MWAAIDEGLPKDRPLTPEEELAALKIQEYHYRKMFHLSKADMDAEPVEDVAFNTKIVGLLQQKKEKEHAIMEMKAKMNAKK